MRKAGSAHTRWLPPLAEVVFVSVLLWVLLGGQASVLLGDGDTGWHIRTGDYIRQERRFPTRDLFSFSRPGAEWFAWEWGSDVLFSLAHRAAGLKGVVLLAGVLIAATSAALFQFLLWRGANVIVAIVVMFAAGSASTIHWLARPHLFTYLLFLVSVWLLELDRRSETKRVWAVAPLAALWTNLHGGFVVLLATLGVYAAGSVLESWRSPRPRPWRKARRYGWLTAAAAVATLANPYTYHLHAHIWQYLNSSFIRDRVEEFQSPRFRGESMMVFELLLAAGLIAVPAVWRRREYATALLLLGLAHAALASVRHVLLYVVAAAPVAAGELTRVIERSRGAWAEAIASLAADYAPAARWRLRFPLWAAGSVALAGTLLDSGPTRWRVEFPREKFPQAALAQVEENIVGRRVFTSDQWGDYLIYHHYPGVRVFIDGRSDFYGPSIGQQYLEAQQAHYRWEEIFARYNFETVLVPPEWPLATVLKTHSGWRVEYDDGQAVVLTKVGDRGRVDEEWKKPS